jgi:F420-dependent oxidoreductase-like protein
MDFRIFIEPQMGATFEDQLRVARTAEDLGFDAFFRSDHFLTMDPGSGLPGPTDSWVTLGALAVQTSRIRLGTLVSSATFRLPGPLAIAVAQVDAMSGGRVELGLGTGWFDAEHAAYGIPFPPLGERFERFEEQLAIVTGLWETPVGGVFDFAGRHYTVSGSPALPKPVQSPRPPIIVGGTGPRRTPRIAARFADEFNACFVPAQTCASLFARVGEECVASGRDRSSIVYSIAQTMCVGRSDAEVDRRLGAIGNTREGLAGEGIAGTAAEVVDLLAAFAEAGASRFYFQILDLHDLDHLEVIAADVVPQLASSSAISGR